MKTNEIVKLMIQGVEFFDVKEFKQAEKKFSETIKHPEFEKERLKQKINAYYNWALTCKELSQLESTFKKKIDYLNLAEEGFSQCLALQKDKVVSFELVRVLILRASCYLTKQPGLALADLMTAREEMSGLPAKVKTSDDFKKCMLALKEIERDLVSAFGDYAYDEGEYKEAIAYYKDAVKLLTERINSDNRNQLENMHLLANIHFNLAECYSILKKPFSLFHFLVSYMLYKKLEQADVDHKDEFSKEKKVTKKKLLEEISYPCKFFDQKPSLTSDQRADNSPSSQSKRKREDLDFNADHHQVPAGSSPTTDDVAKRQKIAFEVFKPKSDELNDMTNSQLREYLAKILEIRAIKNELLVEKQPTPTP